METNLNKKALQSISGGLDMLSDNKTESLSALAEIALILGSERVAHFYQLDENINAFLSSVHFLLKDLNKESALLVSKFINKIETNGVDTVDYKTKYEKALEEINFLNKELVKAKKNA